MGETKDSLIESLVRNRGRKKKIKGRLYHVCAWILDVLTGIFQPVLGFFAAAGLINCMLAMLIFCGMGKENEFYQWMSAITDGFYFFLPVAIGASASKKFGCNPYLGVVIAAAMVYPERMQAAGYPLCVFAVLIATGVGAKLDHYLNKHIPDMMKLLLVPLLTILFAVPFAYLIVEPAIGAVCELLIKLFYVINGIPAIGSLCMGAVVGGLWQVFVLVGLHWVFIPIGVENMSAVGYDIIISPYFAASFAQIMVVLAILIKTNDEKIAKKAFPAFIAGFFGVTEPCIYGVTLPMKKPFVISCAASAIGGAVIGAAQVRCFESGEIGYLGFLSSLDQGIGMYHIMWGSVAVLLAMVTAFVLMMITYQEAPAKGNCIYTAMNTRVSQNHSKVVHTNAMMEVAAPIRGVAKNLHEVEDQIFSKGWLGEGIAIEPNEGKVYAPVSGKVDTIADTGHMLGMTSEEGAEILIHVGINTISLKGVGFCQKVRPGQKVKKGDLLFEFDIEAIHAAGCSALTLVIITNSEEFKVVLPVKIGNVTLEDDIIAIA